MLIGVLARVWGRLRLLSPQNLYDEYLEDSDWTFREHVLYYAGEHFERNRSLINKKGRIADGMTILFVAETIMLLIWVLTEM